MNSPLVPSDLLRIVTLSDPQIAPDARTVYFRRTTLDEAEDSACGNIWRAGADGEVTPFTQGTNDRIPRVSPDGRMLAFVGDRSGETHVFIMPVGGGEARPVGPAYAKIAALAWSPDARRIAVAAQAAHDPATARVFHDERSGARHIRALPFKSDMDGLLDGTRKHVFTIDVDTGAATQLTSGDFDAAAPAWSPDGARIAFAAQIGVPEWSFASDIHIVDCATKQVRALTHGEGPMSAPAWSSDGRSVAFYGHQHGDDAGGRFNVELLVADAEGGSLASLSRALDRTVGDAIISDMRSGFAASPPIWLAGDREIVAQVSDEGSCGLRAFARGGGAVRDLARGERDIFAFSGAPDGSIAFAFSTPEIPADIALLAPDADERRLTFANDAWLAEKLVVTPQRYRPAREDGTVLDAWLMSPSGDAPPLVLQVHGGPHVAYGHSFFFEFQVLAGTGCAVAYGNPRGGQTYGHAYADAITGRWGGVDADDVHCILDGALERAGADRSRIGVAGGSYGGFMTTWLLGHSDRFAAGVSMRAVNDFVSEVGAADIGWFLERELRAPALLADGGRALFEASPMRAARHIDAPLLVEHSERDYRCPIDQGEQLFTLLRRLGKTNVEFVRFTGDGHELSRGGKPRNRILRLRAIAHWFIRHLRPPGGGTPVPPDAGALFRPLPGEPARDAA